MIELALHYAGQGWPVFPLVPGGKGPVIAKREGGRGCHDATTDRTAIERWWGLWPRANVGIATGIISGLLVLDVDVKKGKAGIASMTALKPPPTFTVRTPTGGFHLYFRMPRGVPIGCGTDLKPGIDWRGKGGYVVGTGSVTSDGMYEIVRRSDIADLPLPIAALLRAPHPRVGKSATGGGMIAEGARDDTLIRIAGGIRRYGVEAPALLDALRAINREHCRPPLDETDLERIANSAARYPSTMSRGSS